MESECREEGATFSFLVRGALRDILKFRALDLCIKHQNEGCQC